MSAEILIKVDGISKKFCRTLKRSLWYGLHDLAGEITGRRSIHQELRPKEFWAIDDVTFELHRGECLGLIGRNGAGKTTLLRMLNGLIKPDKGQISIFGRVGALIALGAGFNPILTGRENVYVNGSILGLRKREIDAKFDEIVQFAEIEPFIDTPVQSYSSGMRVRLGFSIATALEPDVLLIDEVLAVGDSRFRAKCYSRLSEIAGQAAVILVSHQMHDIGRVCTQGLLLKMGRILAAGSTPKVIEAYNLENEIALEERHGGNMKVRVISHEVTPHVSEGDRVSLDIRYRLFTDSGQRSVETVLSLKDMDGRIVLQCPYVTDLEPGQTEINLAHQCVPLGPDRFSYGLEVRNFQTLEVYHVINEAGCFAVTGSKRYFASLVALPSSAEVNQQTAKTR